MTAFYTSDTHFSHFNIISYCKRPFYYVEEMNNAMIEKWNEVVSHLDVIYHIGDFAMGNKKFIPEIRKKLNGKIVLIKGNHDPSATKMLEYGFDEVHNKLIIEDGGNKILLKHHPIYDEKLWEDCEYMFCGHVHEEWARKNNMINVGVDVSNFYPSTFEQLINRK